jgi:hypothetical protein
MIRDAYQLSAEATWEDFLVWFGIHAGERTEEELQVEIDELGSLKVRARAVAELARRSRLEAT